MTDIEELFWRKNMKPRTMPCVATESSLLVVEISSGSVPQAELVRIEFNWLMIPDSE
jgi:hypothetical protein